MAESVDALVSNTSGATHPGSIPGLGTKKENQKWFSFFFVCWKMVVGLWLLAIGKWQIMRKDGQIMEAATTPIILYLEI